MVAEYLSEPKLGTGGEDCRMQMGVDSGSKGGEGLLSEALKHFISELLILSVLVFEKFTLQSRA